MSSDGPGSQSKWFCSDHRAASCQLIHWKESGNRKGNTLGFETLQISRFWHAYVAHFQGKSLGFCPSQFIKQFSNLFWILEVKNTEIWWPKDRLAGSIQILAKKESNYFDCHDCRPEITTGNFWNQDKRTHPHTYKNTPHTHTRRHAGRQAGRHAHTHIWTRKIFYNHLQCKCSWFQSLSKVL